MAEQKKGVSEATRVLLKVILGLILLAVGVWLVWLWKWDVWTVIKGFLGMVVILAGVIFLAIAKEPGKKMVQLARIFRRYVSPDTSVEMLKRKTEAKEIVQNFGYRFRPIEQVRKAFFDRPTLDEAMVVLLYEYQTRGQKGYTLKF